VRDRLVRKQSRGSKREGRAGNDRKGKTDKGRELEGRKECQRVTEAKARKKKTNKRTWK
jgi:hypothetical protein